MIKLTLTEQELNALIGLLDAGVRHRGLEAAAAAAVLFEKCQQAATEEDQKD